MSYAEKLLNPKWQRRRLEIMQRDNFSCVDCGSAANTLHVHHTEYLIGFEPWEYEDCKLVTLCNGCHEKRHDIPQPQEAKSISEVIEELPKTSPLFSTLRDKYSAPHVPNTDITSQEILRKALIAYISHLTINRNIELVNLFSVAKLQFVRENYFLIIAKDAEKLKAFEKQKSNFVNYLQLFFNDTVTLSIVIEK